MTNKVGVVVFWGLPEIAGGFAELDTAVPNINGRMMCNARQQRLLIPYAFVDCGNLNFAIE